jgi:hypothetical protein
MIKIKARVDEDGHVKLPPLDVFKGKDVDIIISGEDEFVDLLKASESSLGFWKNEVDDETWNSA